MDTKRRDGPPRRITPRLAFERIHLRSNNDRLIPLRVIRAVEEIILLTDCWKRSEVRPRHLH